MLKALLTAFLLYIAYRFVFHFVIPAFRVGLQVRKQVQQMRAQMEKQQEAYSQPQQPGASTKADKAPAGDYLAFEEIK